MSYRSLATAFLTVAAVVVNMPVCRADVIESNDYGVWHVFGGIGKDGKSLCRLSADIAAIPGAKISFIHVADSTNLVVSLKRDTWNAPQGTITEIAIDFHGFDHIQPIRVKMDASGSTLAAFIDVSSVHLIVSNLVAQPKIHFHGNEPDWTIPFTEQGEPIEDFRRCIKGQQHTQPF